MINIRKKQQEEFKIDMSSLVDVLFTLLIFFSLTSSFVQESGLDVELPEASSSGVITNPRKIELMILKDGSLKYDSQKVTLNDLKKELSKFDNTEKMKYLVVLKADNAAMHGRVTVLLDSLKSMGFKNIAIGTQSNR